ncbi:hypothetical protein OIU78_008026 [Salix suchowensis]|nr:hypothetical protein OIU78_008026 [Salix suchowensis]
MATLGNPLASVPIPSNPAILTANIDQRSNPSTVPVLIDKCASKKHLKQLHAHMLRTGLFFDPPSATKLFTACALSSASSLDYACKVFDQIPKPNLYSWNTLIRAFASSPKPIQGILVFIQMLHESQRFPNSYTFPFVIKAATENGKPKEALAIFRELQLNKNSKPNEVTLASTLAACAQLGSN